MQNITEFKTIKTSEANFKAQPAVPNNSGTPHPALDGKRVTSGSTDAIYFVWKGGYKCHIPDPETYTNIFSDQANLLLPKEQLDAIATGEPLTLGALTGVGNNTVYLFTNGKKHGVTTPKVMDYCKFKQGNDYPDVIVNFVPDGIIINYGQE